MAAPTLKITGLVYSEISTQMANGWISSDSIGFSQTNNRIVHSGQHWDIQPIEPPLCLLYICVFTHAVFQSNWTHNLDDVFMFCQQLNAYKAVI